MARTILSTNATFNCTLYNRKYAKNTLGSKRLDVTFIISGEQSVDLSPLMEKVADIKTLVNHAGIVKADDPILINLIEPKAGNTVHGFLEKAKAQLQGKTFLPVGYTTPPETINGYHIIIMGMGYEVTLEGFAEWLLDMTDDFGVTSVRINDGTIEAEVQV